MKLIYLFPNDFAKKSANRIQTVNFSYALDKHLKNNFLFISGSGYSDDVLKGLGINKKSQRHIEINFKYKKGLTFQFIYKIWRRGIFNQSNILYMRDYKLLKILSFLKNKLVFELHEIPRNDLLDSLKYIDKFVVISKAIKNDLPLFLQQKPCFVVHDGFNNINVVDKSDSPLKFDAKKTIVYIGTYQEWKNIEYIVKLAKKLQDIEFILIGVDELKIQENVNNIKNIQFINYMEHRDIYKVLSKVHYAIYTVNPKFSISKYTSPLKLFEYLSFGITVFAPNYSSIKEIIKDQKNGILYDIENIETSSKMINEVIKNHFLLDKKQVIKSIKQYSWEERAEKVIDFVQS